MLFNSAAFLIFFPVVTVLFFLLPHKFRWSLLLTASCFFYMFFKPVYILILFFTIIIDYFAGILIESSSTPNKRKMFLVMSILANVGVLAVFKYYNFLNDNITGLAKLLGWHNNIPYLKIALPIGLSFHTFQAMSYTIEVYRGAQKSERNFGIYSLYVMFYPQLVAGPIERPQNILHQFHEKKNFSYENAVSGMNLIAFGLFKKVVIADRLAEYVGEVYGNVGMYSTVPVLLASLFFSFQIYCDFSGYCDIAIGAARMMGYNLMDNFNRPYLAAQVNEFWKRWHISLSTWFKDYVYIPLGGNRTTTFKWYRNLAIIFLLSGLWHGASWTFVVWGGLHAFYLIFGLMTQKYRTTFSEAVGLYKVPKINYVLNVFITFALVTFAWIFFRAESFDHAFAILSKISEWNITVNPLQVATKLGTMNLVMCFAAILMLFASYLLPKSLDVKYKLLLFITLVTLTVALGTNGENEFIYFQF